MKPLEIVQLTIATCQAEVEAIIGDVLHASDGGSPWGRAFLKVADQLQKLEDDNHDQQQDIS